MTKSKVEALDIVTEKPEDHLTIRVNGEDKEIFMSGGLVRRLASITGVLSDYTSLFTNIPVQEQLVIECLRPRKPAGKPLDSSVEYSLEDFEMTTEDTEKLIAWVADHCLHFFLSSAASATNLVVKNEKPLTNLMKLTQSPIGSLPSVEETQSAGPSTQSQAS